LEWHVVFFASRSIYHKDMCLKETGLCAQITITIINLKANIIENGHVGPIDEVENLQLDYEEDINLSFKNYT
jgi:hypothetical protein